LGRSRFCTFGIILATKVTWIVIWDFSANAPLGCGHVHHEGVLATTGPAGLTASRAT